MKIFDHTNPLYIEKRDKLKSGKYNGAYYYSKLIVDKIIPNIKTDRNWVTLNVENQCWDHSIVFVHNNKYLHNYEWLRNYDDLILVCSQKETADKLSHLGKTIILPLCIDVEEVENYKKKRKTKDTCFVGRKVKANWGILPKNIDYITELPREELLKELARYKKAYAIGLCAIEAKVLGCDVLSYDSRFPDPSIWEVLDYTDAIKLLQNELDKIDKE